MPIQPLARKRTAAASISDAAMAELRAAHEKQRRLARQVEELKRNLFNITERHMDQAINILRRWLKG